MQEEIENRTVNLAISTTKLTARGIIRLAAKGLAYIKRKSREAALKNEKPDGRQSSSDSWASTSYRSAKTFLTGSTNLCSIFQMGTSLPALLLVSDTSNT